MICRDMNYQILNVIHVSSKLAVGGQPTVSQLVDARAMGLRQIINLRPATEDAGFDEPAEVARLEMGYHCLAISGRSDLTLENVRRFDELLNSVDGVSALIHCASGNRVGALFALRAAWLQGLSVDVSLSIGQQLGLTSLLDTVRDLLNPKQS